MANSHLRYRWPNLYRHGNDLDLPDDSIEQTISNFNAACAQLRINVFESPDSGSTCTVSTNYLMELVTYSSTAMIALLKEREEGYQERLKTLNREREDLAKEREDLAKQREDLAKYREYLRVQSDSNWDSKSAHDEDCVLGKALEATYEYDSSSEFCPGDTPDHISESLASEDDNLASEVREMRNNRDENYYMLNVMRALWNEVSAKRVEGNQSEEGEEDEEAENKEQEEEEEQGSEQEEDLGFQEDPLSASQYGSYYMSSGAQVPMPYYRFPYNSNPLQAASSPSMSPQDYPMDSAFLDGIALRTFSPAEVSSQYTIESNIPQKRQRDEHLE